jgi:hypothetical protein
MKLITGVITEKPTALGLQEALRSHEVCKAAIEGAGYVLHTEASLAARDKLRLAQSVRDAIVAALRLYGDSDLNATEIDALADRYVDNVIIKGCAL